MLLPHNLSESVFRVTVSGLKYNINKPHVPAYSSTWKGSAFCVEWGGRLLFCTNHHVIHNATKIKLLHPHSSDIELTVVASAPGHDVALLAAKSKINFIEAIKVGRSDELVPGEEVFCVGYPGVTEAIQSSKGTISSRELSKDKYPYISIDAVANPGNSGGPILNNRHEVVGILSAGLHSGFFQKSGIQLFVPIDETFMVLQAAIQNENGLFRSPSLDCNYMTLNDSLIKHFKCPPGLLITRIFKNTIIAKKVQVDDVITAINGSNIDSKGMVKVAFWPMKVNFMHLFHRIMNNEFEFKIWSPSTQRVSTITINLEPSQLEYREVIPGIDPEFNKFATYGGLIVSICRKNMQTMNNEDYATSKLIILSVEAETPFEGLTNGKFITHINDKKIENLENYKRVWENELTKKDTILIRTSDDVVSAALSKKCNQAKIDLEKRLKIK